MAKDRESNRPAFTAPLYAALRQGAKELGQVLPAFPESVQCVNEPGTLGDPTAYQVNEQMGNRGYNQMLERYAEQGRQHGERTQELER